MVQLQRNNLAISHPSTAGRTVRQVIDTVVEANQLGLPGFGISIERDVERQVAELACHSTVEFYLSELLQAAIGRVGTGGQLTISACRTARGVEIEIADSESMTDDGPTNAFSRCHSWSPRTNRSETLVWNSSSAPDVFHTRCPQGGQAWTLVFNARLAQARVA